MKFKFPRLLYLIVAILLIAGLACSLAGDDSSDEKDEPRQEEEADPTDTPEPVVEVPTDTPEPVEVLTEEVEVPTDEIEVPMENALYVSKVAFYENEYGDLNVAGILTNGLDIAVDFVELEITVLDSSGNSLYQDTTYSDLSMLASGAESPFGLDTYEALPGAFEVQAVVVDDYFENDYDVPAVIEIANSHVVVDDFFGANIVGEVYNPNDFPVHLAELSVAVFWDDGRIVADSTSSALLNYLPPGVVAPFRLEIWDVGDEIYDADAFKMFYYDARQTDPIDYNITLNGDPWLYLDTYDGFHMAGEIGNEDELILQPYLVAALYDENGNIIDAAEVSIPYGVEPGFLAPYDFTFWGPMDMDPAYFDQVGTYDIFVDYYWTWEPFYETVELTTKEFTPELSDYGILVTGSVTNDTGMDVSSPMVVAYVVDLETNLVIGTNYTWIFEDIADGDTIDFEVDIYTHVGLDPDSVEVITYILADVIE